MDWNEFEITEEIDEEDQAASEDISKIDLVGKFLVTVISSEPVEKTFKAYSFMAASLTMRIDEIYEFDQPILDEKGRAIYGENGFPKSAVVKVTPDILKKVSPTVLGQTIVDEINLFHPQEKKAIKTRRLFVAKQLGILSSKDASLPSSAWANVAGAKVVLKTEWNCWKDKVSEQTKRNARVAWDGYEKTPAGTSTDADLDSSFDGPQSTGSAKPDTSFDTDEFDAI